MDGKRSLGREIRFVIADNRANSYHHTIDTLKNNSCLSTTGAKIAMKKTVKKAVTKKVAAPKKAAVKKVAVEKAVVKKTAVKKAVAKPAAKLKSTSKAFTKSELLNAIAETSGVAKKDVGAVLDVLASVIESHIKKGAIGHFTLPGLLKIKTIRKPATKARKGINPFSGEETMFKAKPARTAVKILPLKKVKEMVA